jgi:hypothetical protein
MADPLEAIGNIGQKMLSVPTDILSVGTRRVTEDMGMMTAKVQELGATLMPAGGLGLPQLPPLPGMPGTESAAPPAPPAQTRSEKTQGVKKTRKTSYLRV